MNEQLKMRERTRVRVLAASRWAASTTVLEFFGLFLVVLGPILALMQILHAGNLLELAVVWGATLGFFTLVFIGLRQES